jgi:hypothetical protein
MIPKFTVIQYLRNKKRVPYGVLVAVKDENILHRGYAFGYSLCNKKDKFNKAMALKVALGRANVDGMKANDNPPHDVRRAAPSFFDRCKKYYKV